MVWGDKYTLAKMREMGYQTFDNWWDESWDALEMRPRLDGLTQSIQTLCNKTPQELLAMYTDMKSVLKHNSNLIKNKSKTDVRDEIKFISGSLK